MRYVVLSATLAALSAVGCDGRQPFVVLTIEDPDGRCTGFDKVAVGFSREAMSTVEPEMSAFPLSLTVTTDTAGDKLIWVEARGADGAGMGRGRTIARFATGGTPTATVLLAQPCDADADCSDGLACTGQEVCDQSTCAPGERACVPSFACITESTCQEGSGGQAVCVVTVDHGLCGLGEYCDQSVGCMSGQGCGADAECDDGLACNGIERCLRGRCEDGSVPCVSAFACVTMTCVELGGAASQCSVTVDHAQCSTGEYCNPAVGCVQGLGCHGNEECDDASPCNGQEQCINLVCVPGHSPTPAEMSDDNPCTLDYCVDPDGFRHALQQGVGWDGLPCTLAGGGAGICLGAKGGCVASACGDGYVDAALDEECDDDNSDDTDRCPTTCELATCGDGKVWLGHEACDTAGQSATCNGDCTLAVCGDGKINAAASEACDDRKNGNACDGCLDDCTTHVNNCGDGAVCPPEACDDGPGHNTNAWSLTRHCNGGCTGWAPYCGDGVIETGDEDCDDGNTTDDNNGCSTTCQQNNICGDVTVQNLFEQCDDGDANACNGCRPDCSRGCICTAPGACLGANWCSLGACIACNVTSHCGPGCIACSGTTPSCGGVGTGCVCDATPAPRGSCALGSYCNAGACSPCNNAQHCGQDCVACGATSDTPVCGGVEVGCITTSCAGKPDFTACQVTTTPDRAYDICVAGVCVSPGCGTAACNPPGASFAHADVIAGWEYPDNNQRTCANTLVAAIPCTAFPCATDGSPAFCGQDAQYGWDATHADPAARWTRTSDGEPVVTDNLTGLIWQGCTGGLNGSACTGGGAITRTWDEAVTYCDQLTWAGYADWQVPALEELASIVDIGRSMPAIDVAVFPATPTISPTWSSSADAINSARAWVANLSVGEFMTTSKTFPYYVRCVRRGPSFPAWGAGARFARSEPVPSSGEYVVSDARTGMVWLGCPAGLSGNACTGTISTMTWQAALAHCEGLSWGNASSWRLPSQAELMSIADRRLSYPAIDAAFPGTPSAKFWSSSSYAANRSAALYVNFTDGYSSNDSKGAANNVRCVRAGP